MSRPLNLWQRILHLIDLSEHVDVEAGAASIKDNVAFRGPNIVILFCAIVIASVGLNVNSIPVIIGAMLISPLMSPIMGFGLALGTNDIDLLWKSLKNLAVMVGISILSAALYFLVSPLDMETPTELLARTNPTIYDVFIAFFGGIAGILEVSRKEKGTVMSGVAIATALMPPLCTVGYGLATLQAHFFFGALYLFFINFTFIDIAAFFGTKYFGYTEVVAPNPRLQRYRKWLVGLLLVAIIVPSVISAVSVIKENNFNRSANAFVRANKNFGKSYIYDYQIHSDNSPKTIELYVAGEEPDDAAYKQVYQSAEQYGFTSQQIIFHLDAAYTNPKGLDENEMVRDMVRNNEERLQLKNNEIAALQTRVDSLLNVIEKNSVPQDELQAEIIAQYPMIEAVVVAVNPASPRMVVAVLTLRHNRTLNLDEQQRLQAWLQVRLHAEQAIVVQNHEK